MAHTHISAMSIWSVCLHLADFFFLKECLLIGNMSLERFLLDVK